jgi:hypothetical protein
VSAFRSAARARVSLLAGLSVTLVAIGGPGWSAEPSSTLAKDRAWSASAVAKGAEESALWSTAAAGGENGTLMRWPSRTKAKPVVADQDLRILVLTGTFTVEWGKEYRELGPGGFLTVPKGLEHTLGCEAAGECLFLVHKAATP